MDTPVAVVAIAGFDFAVPSARVALRRVGPVPLVFVATELLVHLCTHVEGIQQSLVVSRAASATASIGGTAVVLAQPEMAGRD